MSARAWCWCLLGVACLFPSAGFAQGLAPRIEHEAVTQAVSGKPLVVRARVVSASGRPVAGPAVLVRQAGLAGFFRLPMAPDTSAPDTFVAQVPREYLAGGLDYYLEARDEAGNGPGRAGSADAPFHVVVVAAPTPGPAPVTAPDPASAPAPVVAPQAPVPALATGRLLVNTDPPGAAVTVDGVRVGESPLSQVVQAGVPHHVVIEAKGFLPVVTDVTVLPGLDARADLKLVKDDSTSRFLLRLAGSFGFGGPYVHLGDADRYFTTTDDKYQIHSSFNLGLSLTVALAKYNGLVVDLGYGKFELATDREGVEGKTAAKGSFYSAGIGYRVLIGPFSVVRPHVGLLLGFRAFSLEDGDPSRGWGGESKMSPELMADLEAGIAFQLPGHFLLDLSFRSSCLDYSGPLMMFSGGLGLGAHF